MQKIISNTIANLILFFLCLLIPISVAQEILPIKNEASVKIVVEFKDGEGTSSGFLLQKGERFFAVMTAHALHAYENPVKHLRKINIILDSNQIIEVSAEEYQVRGFCHVEKFHGTYGEYVDTFAIDLTNIESFIKLRESVAKYFLQYDQLAGEENINDASGSKLNVSSIYGGAWANMGQRMPEVINAQNNEKQKLLGFEINNCTPEFNQNGGGSGGLITFTRNGAESILGMLLKVNKGNMSVGYAVDSIRIRETIDGGDNVSGNQ